MPSERRQIILSAEETVHAVEAYRRVRPELLPRGPILGFRLDAPEAAGGAPALLVRVEMAYGRTHQAAEVRAEEADLLELLVRCCLENNIPIPRGGSKRAALIDGALALVIDYAGEDLPGGG